MVNGAGGTGLAILLLSTRTGHCDTEVVGGAENFPPYTALNTGCFLPFPGFYMV